MAEIPILHHRTANGRGFVIDRLANLVQSSFCYPRQSHTWPRLKKDRAEAQEILKWAPGLKQKTSACGMQGALVGFKKQPFLFHP